MSAPRSRPGSLLEPVPGGSRIGLGCMPMSWAYLDDASGDEPARVIRRALELGVTHFDTSDVYGPFTNEELVGRALAGRRDGIVVATKVGLRVGPSGGYPLVRDARPERIVREVERSLARLRTDVIDLYYLHRVDEKVAFDEQWAAMASLVQAGKVRAIGLSEVDVPVLERASEIHPVAAVQSELSLWTRDALEDVVPWCHDQTAFVPYAPLGRGYLTGTLADASFGSADVRATNPRFTRRALHGNVAIVEVVRRVGQRLDATPAQVALAWVLAQGAHLLPIPSTRRVTYLEENVAAGTLRLSDADLAELDAIPQAVGTRY